MRSLVGKATQFTGHSPAEWSLYYLGAATDRNEPTIIQMLRYPSDHVIQVGAIDPKYDRVYKASSRSISGKHYEVNVAQLTCSCSEFRGRRAEHPIGEVRRVCASLRQVVSNEGRARFRTGHSANYSLRPKLSVVSSRQCSRRGHCVWFFQWPSVGPGTRNLWQREIAKSIRRKRDRGVLRC